MPPLSARWGWGGEGVKGWGTCRSPSPRDVLEHWVWGEGEFVRAFLPLGPSKYPIGVRVCVCGGGVA